MNDNIRKKLKQLWGASKMPFGSDVQQLLQHENYQNLRHQLEQMLQLHCHGIVHGANGCGKSMLIQHFIEALPQKQYQPVVLTHSTLHGSDYLRTLCHLLHLPVRFRRSDNVLNIQKYFCEQTQRWPVIVLEEAQNLNATALEEIRLLCHPEKIAQTVFSLILVGDETLLTRLTLGFHRPLLSRISYRMEMKPLKQKEIIEYMQLRLHEANIHEEIFSDESIHIIQQASNGIPRLLNHIAQIAIEKALQQEDRQVRPQYVQEAVEQLPWLLR